MKFDHCLKLTRVSKQNKIICCSCHASTVTVLLDKWMKEEHVTTMLKTGHFLLLQQILHKEHLRYKPRPRRPGGISLLSCEIVGFWAGRNIKLYAAKLGCSIPGSLPLHYPSIPKPLSAYLSLVSDPPPSPPIWRPEFSNLAVLQRYIQGHFNGFATD